MNLLRKMRVQPLGLGHSIRSRICGNYFPSSTSSSPGHTVFPAACQAFHSSQKRCKKVPLSSEPTRYSSSPANLQSMPDAADRNENQPIIVALSMVAFIFYFFLLREENDLDEQLNVGLFERIPALEEPHLAQAIPRMKARGEDTREAEARLKELIAQRKAGQKH